MYSQKLTFTLFIFFICSSMFSFGQEDKMKQAYELSNDIVRDRLDTEDKEYTRMLNEVEESDLIVVEGTYDHIHLVLESLKLPYMRVSQSQLIGMQLKKHQTVFVNCPSSFPVAGAKKLAEFVNLGGQLITTDWALKHVLEVGFPGTVKFNNSATADEVVRIEMVDKNDDVIKGFLDEETDPVWWLEGSSYPIEILDKERVKVLIRSKEMEQKYGAAPVIVKFGWGEGEVYHMISHFYLQRTETRDKKQTASAMEYGKLKGASKATLDKLEKPRG